MNKILLLVLSMLTIALGTCSDDNNKNEGIRGINGEKLNTPFRTRYSEEKTEEAFVIKSQLTR